MKRTSRSFNLAEDIQIARDSAEKEGFTSLKRTKSTLNIWGEDPRDPFSHPIKIKKVLSKEYFKLANKRDFSFINTVFEKYEVDINTKDPSNGMTLLHYAIMYRDKEIIVKLLFLGAKLDARSSRYPKVLTPNELAKEILDSDLINLLRKADRNIIELGTVFSIELDDAKKLDTLYFVMGEEGSSVADIYL